MKEKQYIVRKYIMAKSASEAIKKEKNMGVDEVFVDEDWMEEHYKKDPMGFEKK